MDIVTQSSPATFTQEPKKSSSATRGAQTRPRAAVEAPVEDQKTSESSRIPQSKSISDLTELKTKVTGDSHSTGKKSSKISEKGQANDGLLGGIGAENQTEGTLSQVSSSRRREERGSSFCDIISSSKSSIHGSNSSLILEDDGSSSDAGASSSDEFGNGRTTRRLNRSTGDNDCDEEDEDLEEKIKFFFQRIEQQEIVGLEQPTIQVHDVDSDLHLSTLISDRKHLNDSIDHSFASSDSGKITDSALIGKRSHSEMPDLELQINSSISSISSSSSGKRAKTSGI
jgi:hypothetical protein